MTRDTPIVVEVLDAGQPPEREASRRGWVVGLLALALVAAGLVVLRPPAQAVDPVGVRLVGHTGSALTGQSFVRFYFALTAVGGDAEVEDVELLLGGGRAEGVTKNVLAEGERTTVLVDVVPDCPRAVRELPVGTLQVTYRDDAGEQVASLPLPVEGSLPRLVQKRCAELDRL